MVGKLEKHCYIKYADLFSVALCCLIIALIMPLYMQVYFTVADDIYNSFGIRMFLAENDLFAYIRNVMTNLITGFSRFDPILSLPNMIIQYFFDNSVIRFLANFMHFLAIFTFLLYIDKILKIKIRYLTFVLYLGTIMLSDQHTIPSAYPFYFDFHIFLVLVSRLLLKYFRDKNFQSKVKYSLTFILFFLSVNGYEAFFTFALSLIMFEYCVLFFEHSDSYRDRIIKILKSKPFIHDFMFVGLTCIFLFVLRYAFPGGYSGNDVGSINLIASIKMIYRYAIGTSYWYNNELFSLEKISQYEINKIYLSAYIFVIGIGFSYFIHKLSKISFKNIIFMIIFSNIFIFSFLVLYSLTDKFIGWYNMGNRAYVLTPFAYASFCLLPVSVIALIQKINFVWLKRFINLLFLFCFIYIFSCIFIYNNYFSEKYQNKNSYLQRAKIVSCVRENIASEYTDTMNSYIVPPYQMKDIFDWYTSNYDQQFCKNIDYSFLTSLVNSNISVMQNDHYSFATDSGSVLLRSTGLSGQESWGRWSDTDLAPTIRLMFSKPLVGRYKISLTIASIVEQEVKFEINGMSANMPVTDKLGLYTIEVSLDEPVYFIELTPTTSVRLSDKIENSDTRNLSLSFYEIAFEKLD